MQGTDSVGGTGAHITRSPAAPSRSQERLGDSGPECLRGCAAPARLQKACVRMQGDPESLGGEGSSLGAGWRLGGASPGYQRWSLGPSRRTEDPHVATPSHSKAPEHTPQSLRGNEGKAAHHTETQWDSGRLARTQGAGGQGRGPCGATVSKSSSSNRKTKASRPREFTDH